MDEQVERIIKALNAAFKNEPTHYTVRRVKRSKYMPHQGERECARRAKQMFVETVEAQPK